MLQLAAPVLALVAAPVVASELAQMAAQVELVKAFLALQARVVVALAFVAYRCEAAAVATLASWDAQYAAATAVEAEAVGGAAVGGAAVPAATVAAATDGTFAPSLTVAQPCCALPMQ